MQIAIHQLKINCIIGILSDERLHPQEIELDVVVDLDLDTRPSISIDETVDYAVLAELCTAIMLKEKFPLLENAVLALAQAISARWPNIKSCELHLKKPKALNQGLASVKLSKKF